jgi:hypothetical protein
MENDGENSATPKIGLDPVGGVVVLEGRRVVLFHADAVAASRVDVVEALGPDQGHRACSRSGFVMGQRDAEIIRREYPVESERELMLRGCGQVNLFGLAALDVSRLEVSPGAGNFHISGTWKHSYLAENRALHERVAAPLCWELAGYLSGLMSAIRGETVLVVEDQCVAGGAKACHFEGKPAASWSPAVREQFEQPDIARRLMLVQAEMEDLRQELGKGFDFGDITAVRLKVE